MKFSSLVALSLCVASSSAFTTGPLSRPRIFSLRVSTESLTSASNASAGDNDVLGLTPELLRMTNAFQSIGDDKMRYKQLLYMANKLAPLEEPSTTMVPENKVPGCLSTVYVDGKAILDEETGEYLIDFVGESDGLLTKGLVALLVRGLSENTAADIQKVSPEFINEARISQSLTPSRNNGFLNMLVSMKRKALELEEQAKSGGKVKEIETVTAGDRPMYNLLLEGLQRLKPVSLEITDTSPDASESQFEVEIVAEAFDGLAVEKRQQLIGMILGAPAEQLEDLQIRALTPAEAADSKV